MLPGPELVPSPDEGDWSALKEAVQRFECAWRQGLRPALGDHLPATGALRARVLIELVHIELELRLKAGETARVEEYLARYPELADDRDFVLELIAAEFELRGRREPELTRDEYLQRFPQSSRNSPSRWAGRRSTRPTRVQPT
jgi:eukaryotic-like serine/threonine-protein kinase